MLKMEVLIYPPLLIGGFDNEPMECTVEGKPETTIELLKNELDEVVLSTLRQNKYASNNYLVEFSIEKHGEHIDRDGPVECYCNLESECITWEDGK